MDIKTVIRILDLIQPQIDEKLYAHIATIIRKEHVMDEIAVREEFLARKVQDAVIRAKFQQELPKLQALLASL